MSISERTTVRLFANIFSSRLLKPALLLLITGSLSGCVTSQSGEKIDANRFHESACGVSTTSSSSWHIRNLYDCDSREFYIPYQLWTGVSWNGNTSDDCMHAADTRFSVNSVSLTTIKGPQAWRNPKTGADHRIWVRDKVDGSKTQYFSCHEKGIGRVFDSRQPKFYSRGRCKFPAGYGWRLNKRRHCHSTSIKIIDVGLDDSNNLRYLEYMWWYGSTLDHVYRYEPNVGMTNAWPQ